MRIRRKMARLWGIGAGISAAVILALLAAFGFQAGVAHANGGRAITVCFDDTGACCTLYGITDNGSPTCDIRVECTGLANAIQCDTHPVVNVSCSEIDSRIRLQLTLSCAAPEANPSVWLADVCEPYYGGMFDQYEQMTFDTDYGKMLYVGPSADGPWTAVQANGPQWVLTMSDIDTLAASQGVEPADLWFTAGSGDSYANARLLSSMVTDRAAGWGDDCTPIDGGPSISGVE